MRLCCHIGDIPLVIESTGFAQRLAALLQERGMTQLELAASVGVTRAAMSRYVSGDREPQFVTLVRIAEELDAHVEDLVPSQVARLRMRCVSWLVRTSQKRSVPCSAKPSTAVTPRDSRTSQQQVRGTEVTGSGPGRGLRLDLPDPVAVAELLGIEVIIPGVGMTSTRSAPAATDQLPLFGDPRSAGYWATAPRSAGSPDSNNQHAVMCSMVHLSVRR